MDPALECDVHQLKAKLADVLLVDCRRNEEWGICRIEGATLCPLGEFTQHVAMIKERAQGRQVIVYCHTGRRSLVGAHMLRKAGVEALSLHGGIEAWADIDETIKRY